MGLKCINLESYVVKRSRRGFYIAIDPLALLSLADDETICVSRVSGALIEAGLNDAPRWVRQ